MKYRPEIDGLRAVAILPVILFHSGIRYFRGGFVGVDVFFVISGYLITSIILDQLSKNKFSIANFYERRARRILPALFFVLGCCIPVAWWSMFPRDLKIFSSGLAATVLFSSNIYLWLTTGYFSDNMELNPLLHTWSLAVEEQYYLLFPLFLGLTTRFKRQYLITLIYLTIIFSLSLAIWGAKHSPAFSFFMLPTRLWEILLGSLVAFHLGAIKEKKNSIPPFLSQTLSLSGLFMIFFSVFTFNKLTPHPAIPTLIPTLGTALIILFGTAGTWVGRALSYPALVGIGLVSYSAYLCHQPLFAFARLISLREPEPLIMLVIASLSFLLAFFSWKFIETPFRKDGFLTRKQILKLAASGVVCFFILGISGILTGGFPGRLNQEVLNILNTQWAYSEETRHCHRFGTSFISLSSSCVLGEKPDIVGALIGDSQAVALSAELGKALAEKHKGIIQATFVGCPPIKDVYRIDGERGHKCSEFNEQASDFIEKSKKLDTIVISSSWAKYLVNTEFDNFEGGIDHSMQNVDLIENGIKQNTPMDLRIKKLSSKFIEMVSNYLKAGKKVVLVYPIPEAGWYVPEILAKKILTKQKSDAPLSTSYQAFSVRNKFPIEVLDSIGKRPNLFRVYPEKILCNSLIKNRCLIEHNGVPLYVDRTHLSNHGAKLIAPEIAKFF